MNYLNSKNKELNIFVVNPQNVGAVHTHTHTLHLNNVLKIKLKNIKTIQRYRNKGQLCPLFSDALVWSFCVL